MTLDSLIADTADRYDLPPAVVRAIITVESSGDPWATRYEPAFYSRYVAGRGHRVYPGCSRDTEERLRATSFGLMQVMGQTAREHGYDGSFLTALCDPATGVDYGCQVLRAKLKRYAGDMDSALAAYNAGSVRRNPDGTLVNLDYVNKVKKAMKGLGKL